MQPENGNNLEVRPVQTTINNYTFDEDFKNQTNIWIELILERFYFGNFCNYL